MGNHEFCTGCHESDFHHGQTCEEAYPESRKRVLREEKARKAEDRVGRFLLGQLRQNLMRRYHLDEFDLRIDGDKMTVYGFSLARARKRRSGMLRKEG